MLLSSSMQEMDHSVLTAREQLVAPVFIIVICLHRFRSNLHRTKLPAASPASSVMLPPQPPPLRPPSLSGDGCIHCPRLLSASRLLRGVDRTLACQPVPLEVYDVQSTESSGASKYSTPVVGTSDRCRSVRNTTPATKEKR